MRPAFSFEDTGTLSELPWQIDDRPIAGTISRSLILAMKPQVATDTWYRMLVKTVGTERDGMQASRPGSSKRIPASTRVE